MRTPYTYRLVCSDTQNRLCAVYTDARESQFRQVISEVHDQDHYTVHDLIVALKEQDFNADRTEPREFSF